MKIIVITLIVPNTALKNFLSNFSRWFILVALAFALSRTHGSYGMEFFLLVLLGITLFTGNILRGEVTPTDLDIPLLKFTLAFFLLRLFSHSSLVYTARNFSDPLVPTLIGLATLSGILYIFRPKKLFFVASFVFLSVLLLLIPLFSPNPQIDVFTLSNKAIEHLFAGTNPYAVEYQDKLSEPFGYRPGYTWPSGALLLSALSKKLFGDIRVILALALIGSSIFLARIGKEIHGTSTIPWLFALLWLAFPVNPLVVEQAWIDPLLILTAVMLAYGLQKKKALWIALSLGFHLSIKQYGIITYGLTLLWLWRSVSFHYSIGIGAAAFAIFALIVGPFVIQAPQQFLQMAYLDAFQQAPRSESFTLYAFLNDAFGISMPDWVTALTLLICLSYFAFKWWRIRPQLPDWSLALFLTTFLGFLFARRAFCNYFHFSAIFLVLYLLCSFERKNESHS